MRKDTEKRKNKIGHGKRRVRPQKRGKKRTKKEVRKDK